MGLVQPPGIYAAVVHSGWCRVGFSDQLPSTPPAWVLRTLPNATVLLVPVSTSPLACSLSLFLSVCRQREREGERELQHCGR